MKYVQPYGVTDPNASYINGDPTVGRAGSIPPAEAFEHPMRELVGVISKSKFTPDAADLFQLTKAVRSQRVNYADDTGSVNSLSVAYDPPITSYTVGLPICVKVLNTNTGGSTIDAGGGRVPIRKPTGAATGAGDLVAGGLVWLVYDGAGAFQMINFGGAGGGLGTPVYINIPYTVDSSPTPNLITANFSPAITALAAGNIFMVKIANTNTGPTVINIQSLGNKPVFALGGGDLLPSDIAANDVVILSYDGSRFYIAPNIAMSQDCTINVPTAQFPTPAAVFNAIGRKRIPPNVTLTISLAIGTYSPITTYHVDADRIVLQGTMKAAAPSGSDFAKTGNTAGARAADSASNIAMLRTRFGTEIHFTNAQLNGLQHAGPGRPTFKNILVTGENVLSSQPGSTGAIVAPRGGAVYCDTCAVWGSGGYGFAAIESVLDALNCFACSCMQDGYLTTTRASMVLDTCGSYGNTLAGYEAETGSQIYFYRGCQGMMNGSYGALAGQISGFLSATSQLTGNGLLDVYAFDLSMVNGNGSTWGTSSPVTNSGPGNNGSLVKSS